LVEFMLRLFQSLVIDPGRPPHKAKELRAFLRRWVAPAISSSTHSPPPAHPRAKSTKSTQQRKTSRRAAATT
jgi:hypothetical protein